MAFNPYFPVNYPQYYPNYPTQSNAYNALNQPQSVAPAQSIIWVSGSQEASMYPIAPNNAVTLWDKSGKTVYVKSADATGKPNMIVYDLVQRAESPSDSVSNSDSKLPTYASKDELDAIILAIKERDEVIDNLKTDIDNMKSDMYGIAGKKKKKVTEDDE